MNEITEHFRLALKHHKDRSGAKIEQIAEACGKSARQVQGVLSDKERKGLGGTARLKVAEFFGTTYQEMLALGEALARGDNPPRDVHPATEDARGYMSVARMEVVVQEVMFSYRALEATMRLWKSAFEALPVYALLIEDGVVIEQNRLSRKMGLAIGGALCEQCVDSGCHGGRDLCAVHRAIATGIEASEARRLNGVLYQVNAAPLNINGVPKEYVLVTAVAISEELTGK